MREYGKALKAARRKHQLSVKGLERISGVHRNTIFRAERDPSTLTLFNFMCLCDAMGEPMVQVLKDAECEDVPRDAAVPPVAKFPSSALKMPCARHGHQN